ncbi:MAG: hypothetical protein LPJ93_04160 [Rhodobacterales bacterium]|nr:hypothetical protein [Rhodobacterales bacterium]
MFQVPEFSGGLIRRVIQFLKDEFVDAPVPASIAHRYADRAMSPEDRMENPAYQRLCAALQDRLSEEECRFLFLAHGLDGDAACDVAQIANRYRKPLYYVATVLRGAECLLENNKAIRPHLQAILDLRFEDTLDLATTYADLRRPGVAKNIRIALVRGYMASLTDLERAAMRICYGSALEACMDVTARHYHLHPARKAPRARRPEPARAV